MRRSVPALFLFLSFACIAAPADAQDTFPADWAGLWEIVSDKQDCQSNPLGTETDTSAICTGDTLTPDEEGFELDCTGTVDSTRIDLVCSDTQDAGGDCLATITYTLEALRTGDIMTGIQTTTITYAGEDCGSLENTCTATEFSGTRIGPEPPECVETATTSISWARIKARYK